MTSGLEKFAIRSVLFFFFPFCSPCGLQNSDSEGGLCTQRLEEGLGLWAAVSDPDLEGTSRREECPGPRAQAVCESLLLLQCRPLCIRGDVTLETEAQEE